MNDCGQRISELRKKNNLTQLELGNKLNVTAQAVSKWENGASEPDIDTLRKISSLFNISIDELLSNELPQAEVSATAEPATQQPQQVKLIVGTCERCKKEVSAGEYSIAVINHTEHSGRSTNHYTTQHMFCNDCYKKYQEEEHRKQIEKTKREAQYTKSYIDKSFRRGTVWGILAALVAVLAVVIGLSYTTLSTGVVVVLAIVAAYGMFAMVFQCFFDGYVLEILDFFTRSFNMPGFIFSLDLDSIVWMITTKILLGFLLGVLSAMIFLVGVLVAVFCSLFTFPFAMKKNFDEKRQASAKLENANQLK